jgi:bifunctional diaminopimelate decarboxylase / aspartate kinase
MIPDEVGEAIARATLPCFVYDAAVVRQRAAEALSLVDRYFYPVKACPEPEIVLEAFEAGSGLDLCSEGDMEIARAVGCPGRFWKFTSAVADDWLFRRLAEAGAMLDADSLEQGLRWAACGGAACGLRITAQKRKALYGAKFGLPARAITDAVRHLAAAGVRVGGLHLHDQHTNLTPLEYITRLAENLAEVDPEILCGCRYVNVGGSWPMRHGSPASVEELRKGFSSLRERLAALGFNGALLAEPGRWVVGPCGYWAAQVSAIKPDPKGEDHKVVVLDTSAPVPCRPSMAPFVVLRGGRFLDIPKSLTCDIFGSANTALDLIGAGVRLPVLAPGDIVISTGQGAYTRALIPPFNERERPQAIVVGGRTQGSK